MPVQTKPIPSNLFRRIFSNWFQLGLSDNDLSVAFGLEQKTGLGGDEGGPIAEAQVFMTPRSAKVLMLLLQNAIKTYEANVGEIPLTPGKAEEIEAMMESARKTANAAPDDTKPPQKTRGPAKRKTSSSKNTSSAN